MPHILEIAPNVSFGADTLSSPLRGLAPCMAEYPNSDSICLWSGLGLELPSGAKGSQRHSDEALAKLCWIRSPIPRKARVLERLATISGWRGGLSRLPRNRIGELGSVSDLSLAYGHRPPVSPLLGAPSGDGERARSSSDLQAQQLADAQRENAEHQVTGGSDSRMAGIFWDLSYCKFFSHSTIKPPLCMIEGSGYHFLRALLRGDRGWHSELDPGGWTGIVTC